MSLPSAFLDELRSRLSVSAVVGRSVQLVKKGRDHTGLCPFHNEKTPSFTVNDDKGFYHCFGCGAHGDVISFVSHHYRLSFLDAVERLAGEAGLDMPRASEEERQADAQRGTLLDALDVAAGVYSRMLYEPAGAEALAYLRGRGLTDETIAAWRLGWAPGRDALKRALHGPRWSVDQLIQAGLLRRREDGSVSDQFYQRVMFPIADRRGRVIAFGGRIISGDGPKYVNSPETPLFHKGSALYGLAQARMSAGETGRMVVAEGYLDVLAMHQAGITNAVAPLGTAITEGQLAEGWRQARDLVLCLDGDDAGQAAMERALDRALPSLSPDRRISFARLPSPHDPDSLIRAQGVEALRRCLEAARPVEDVGWSICAKRHDPTVSVCARAAMHRDLCLMASRVEDAVTRRVLLSCWRRYFADEFESASPMVWRGKRKPAPQAGGEALASIWAHSRLSAGACRDWLKRQGVDLDGLDKTLGGVGHIRARIIKGRYPEGAFQDIAPPPPLWEPSASGPALVIIPAWADAPDPDAPPVDLIGWDPASGKLALLAGAVDVLGGDLIAEAWGFEARGLSRPVAVADGPLSWLRRTSHGQRSVLLVDWGRAWEALGSVKSLLVDDVDFGERLRREIKLPRVLGPKFLFSGELLA